MRIAPASGRRRPAIIGKVVVLQAPFGAKQRVTRCKNLDCFVAMARRRRA
jgi:hypothetical protein